MTVQGPIRTTDLGMTHIHEHLYIDCRPILNVHPYEVESDEPLTTQTAAEARWNPGAFRDNYHQTNVDLIVEELQPFTEAGGQTIVEVTPSHLSRAPDILRDISKRSGVHVVMGGGYYLAPTHPKDVARRSTDSITQELVGEWRHGVGDTGIRPGIYGEIGTSDPVEPEELRMLQAVAWAHLDTGVPISVHLHPWGTEGVRVLDVLEGEGVDPARVILGHMNTAIDDERYQRALLERGVNLAYDLMGFDHSLIGIGRYPPSDLDVITGIVRIAEWGHLEQLFVSQDMGGVKTRLLRYGGWGYAHVLRHVVPLFLCAGWGAAQVDTLLVHNPARVLAVPGLDGT